MKNFYFQSVFCFLLLVPLAISAQHDHDHHGPVVCYGSGEINDIYIPPPSNYLLKSGTQNANISVTYVGFSEEAKTAFQKAVDIWESMIYSPVTIRMEARWESLDQGVLGSCAPSTFYRDFDGASNPDQYYPVALAEKILGRNLNNDEPDLVARFNKNLDRWYFGTDGDTPTDKYDMVSIVLHEICHGLGFYGSMYIDDDQGAWGIGLPPRAIVFDHYIQNRNGKQLIDLGLYDNPSAALKGEYISTFLYFGSPIARNINDNDFPRLYAPSVFNEGSSIYHLNDATYNGTENALMTHAASFGEAIHDPGPLTMAMFAEIGWIHTRFELDSLKDIEVLEDPLLEVEIISDTAIKTNTAYLHYSYDEFDSEDSVLLSYTGTGNDYTVNIPIPSLDRNVYYYLTVEDVLGKRYRYPTGEEDPYYRFYAGADVSPPEIDHEFVEFVLFSVDTIPIRAEVIDNMGVDTVFLEYQINNVDQPDIPLTYDTLDFYEGNILFAEGELEVGDVINYRIKAVDVSSNANAGYLPESGYAVVPVEEVPPALDAYKNDFSDAERESEFLLKGFTIYTFKEFEMASLQTDHPYYSPEEDNKTYNYIAQLKTPIIIREEFPYIVFDEIALVEPGEPGTKYGNEEFWDYCIIEGSKDEGNTWEPFIPGYDCRERKVWEDLYRAGLPPGESTSTTEPGKNLYYKRIVDMKASNKFVTGDQVLIRFRLFSDPYANGWGWSIRNLRIQGDVTSITGNVLDDDSFLVYPNPANQRINFKLTGKINPLQGVTITLYDLMGKEIKVDHVATIFPGEAIQVDVDGVLPGIYVLRVENESSQFMKRVSIQ
jgi:hypothetical protein